MRRVLGTGRWIIPLAVMIAVVIAALLWVRSESQPPADDPSTVRIIVPQGATARSLGRQLEREGVIRNATLFEARLRARGQETDIKAGTYDLPGNLPLDEIVETLVEGRTVLVPVTVPEGLRLERSAGVVARALGIDSTAFVAAATDPALADSLGIPHDTLEGYLFPETYRVDPATGPREMARHMVMQFKRVFSPEWRARADSLGRSIHEIVTLASIVEKEARRADERGTISGVFWNRLDRGMRLEADPTIQYALGGHRSRVLYRDLETESPYNTYLNEGLPPAPIASPGRASIEATLYPDSVPYLYFFATGEAGRHTFSRTYAEHNRKRRELGR